MLWSYKSVFAELMIWFKFTGNGYSMDAQKTSLFTYNDLSDTNWMWYLISQYLLLNPRFQLDTKVFGNIWLQVFFITDLFGRCVFAKYSIPEFKSQNIYKKLRQTKIKRFEDRHDKMPCLCPCLLGYVVVIEKFSPLTLHFGFKELSDEKIKFTFYPPIFFCLL